MNNQNDRFWGGFLSGAIFGSITGGLLGTWLASKLAERLSSEAKVFDEASVNDVDRKPKEPPFSLSKDQTMEEARQGLDRKIAQLNDAIDHARKQLSKVNGNAQE